VLTPQTRALQAALEAADANTPAAARAAAARRRELEHQLEGLRKEIGRLAPGDLKSSLAPGLDALKIRIEELRGRRDSEMAGLGLDALPERIAVEDEIRKNSGEAEQLAASVDTAGAGLKGLTQAVEEAREEFDALQRKLAAEQRELDTKKAVLAAGRNRAGSPYRGHRFFAPRSCTKSTGRCPKLSCCQTAPPRSTTGRPRHW